MVVLTLAMISDTTKGDPKSITKISFKDRQLTEADAIALCAAVKTLDLSSNKIRDLGVSTSR